MYWVQGHDDRRTEGNEPMTDRLRRAMRRLDDWTLIAFNPQPVLRRR
jgi:hypothetical protein